MALSQVAICNLALSRIGSSRQISSLDENSTEARQSRALFEPMRDAVLEDFSWPFATKRVALAKVADDPNIEWTFSYRYPPDCMRVLYVLTGSTRLEDLIPFAFGLDDAGKLIFMDLDQASIAYTAKVTNVAVFPVAFASALAWRIASELAMPLTKQPAIAAHAWDMYRSEVSVAEGNAANERRQDPPPDPEFIAARA